jgi:nitrogen fixation protein FixH
MSDKKTHGNYWKSTIFGLVALFIVSMIVSLSLAARRVSRVVDRDYYVHGLDYQREGEQLTNGVRMGWRLETAYNDGIVRVKATDGAGRPVSGGRVTLRNSSSAGMVKGDRTFAVPRFTEESPGVYSARLGSVQDGDLQGQIIVNKDNAAIASRLVILR